MGSVNQKAAETERSMRKWTAAESTKNQKISFFPKAHGEAGGGKEI
jgi:hypothetical protein